MFVTGRLLVQIHDELLLEAADDHLERVIGELSGAEIVTDLIVPRTFGFKMM